MTKCLSTYSEAYLRRTKDLDKRQSEVCLCMSMRECAGERKRVCRSDKGMEPEGNRSYQKGKLTMKSKCLEQIITGINKRLNAGVEEPQSDKELLSEKTTLLTGPTTV